MMRGKQPLSEGPILAAALAACWAIGVIALLAQCSN
jgi:hypothetical protein